MLHCVKNQAHFLGNLRSGLCGFCFLIFGYNFGLWLQFDSHPVLRHRFILEHEKSIYMCPWSIQCGEFDPRGGMYTTVCARTEHTNTDRAERGRTGLSGTWSNNTCLSKYNAALNTTSCSLEGAALCSFSNSVNQGRKFLLFSSSLLRQK